MPPGWQFRSELHSSPGITTSDVAVIDFAIKIINKPMHSLRSNYLGLKYRLERSRCSAIEEISRLDCVLWIRITKLKQSN
jgi:hypothetical protein